MNVIIQTCARIFLLYRLKLINDKNQHTNVKFRIFNLKNTIFKLLFSTDVTAAIIV